MQKVLRRGRQKHICSSLIRLVWYRWMPLKNSRLELVYLTLIFTGIFGISRPKLLEGIRIYLQGETPTLATSCEELTHWKRPWCWERLRAGGEGDAEDEMVGWHHWLEGHGFGWTPGVCDGQGGLACCGSWGRKESDTTEQLNWTELKKNNETSGTVGKKHKLRH